MLTDRASAAVTFVENHDVVRDDPIVRDKMLAYAFILTHQGYPCVFGHWLDHDSIALAVLVIGIGTIMLLALNI